MKILILGSEGFIGTHVVSYFLAKENVVYGADLFQLPSKKYYYSKISNFQLEVDELLQQKKFDVIVNCSGSANVSFSNTHPLVDYEANCHNTIVLLESIRKFLPDSKYIHLSSAAVYGNPLLLPVRESAQLQPLSPYGYHKLMAEQICHEYSSIYGLKIAILRPFSVYGAGQNKLMFWDVYQKIIKAESSVELYGTGNESRDYVYVEDLMQALDLIIEKSPMNCSIYNVASGKETTIKEAIDIYFSLLKPNYDYYFDNHVRSGDPINWMADISELSKLGFRPKFSLEEGLKNYINWLENKL